MRRDEKGQPLGRELVNLFPEIAPRLRVHPRSRLIEQKQLWPVNEAGGEREALFPAARKLTGELLLPAGKPELRDAFPDHRPPILQPVHAGHEIQILLDAEVFPETETLRHVADLAFDRLAFRDDIVAEQEPLPSSARSKPQSMRRKVVLPLPFGPRNP